LAKYFQGHCRTLLHRVFLFCLIWEGGQMASAKEQMLEVLRNQPDDSSYNELLRELAFVQMVERGVADSDAGRTISHEDMLSRIRSWQR
jgi:predicted transcriptional regulator